MSFKAATLASIAALLKVPVAELERVAKDPNEVDITVKVKEGDKEVDKVADFTSLQAFTTEELATRDTNLKESSKGGNITAGKEIAMKEFKTLAGVELEGKDPGKILEAIKTKTLTEAKIPEAEKVKELNTQLDLLKGQLLTKDQEILSVKGQATEATRDARILASLPANRNPAISDGDYLLMIKARIKVKDVDGNEVYQNEKGEDIRDNLAKPKGLVDVVKDVFTTNAAWNVPGGAGKDGRGGFNSKTAAGTGGVPTSLKEAQEQWVAQGKSLNDSAGLGAWVSELQKENKDFVLDVSEAAGEKKAAPDNGGAGL